MQDLKILKESPSQTAGPYVHIGCVPNFSGIKQLYPSDLGEKIKNDKAKGEQVTIKGCVWDGTGTPLKDAMVEVWQADSKGIYASGDPRGNADPNFYGFARFAGDYSNGEWILDTVKPGIVPFTDGRMQAPHITFWIVARGINIGLHTRMYFPDENNDDDPVLTQLEHQNRIPTLIAVKEDSGIYRFDIRLQGDDETVFFDV